MTDVENLRAIIFEFDGSLGMREFSVDDVKSTMERLVREGYEVIVKTENEKKLEMHFGEDYFEQWRGRRTRGNPTIRVFTAKYSSETESEKFYDDVLKKLGGMEPAEVLIFSNDRNLLLDGKKRGFDTAHFSMGKYGNVYGVSYSTTRVSYLLQHLGIEERVS